MASIRYPVSVAKPIVASSTTVTVGASTFNVGAQQYRTTSNMTLTASTVGANGLDTGTVSGFKPYFIHFIVYNGAPALLGSLSKTAPTLPSGVTQFSWSGWCFVADSSNLIVQVVNSTSWDIRANASTITPVNFGTITVPVWNTRRAGDTLEAVGSFTSGTLAAVSASFTLPAGLTIDTTKLPSNAAGTVVGMIYGPNSAAANQNMTYAVSGGTSNGGFLFYDGSTSTSIFAGEFSTNTTLVKSNASSLFNAGPFTLNFRVPISGWSATDI
jgi:hypothetical protein